MGEVQELFESIRDLSPQDKLRVAAELIDQGREHTALKIIDMAREPLLIRDLELHEK